MRWKTMVYLARKPRKARGGDSQHLRAIGLPLNPGECEKSHSAPEPHGAYGWCGVMGLPEGAVAIHVAPTPDVCMGGGA